MTSVDSGSDEAAASKEAVENRAVTGQLPDAPQHNWVDVYAPAFLRPYFRLARIDRPIGWQLLLMPCWWSSALAAISANASPGLWHLCLFAIGAIAMRGAGSTYNDLADKDLDAKVARTRARPLPSGQVSPKAATFFVLFQCLIGLAVLLQFNTFSIMLGFAALLPVLAYPFMKRLISMPQIVLGLAFAWGGLMGWAVTFGRLEWPAIMLYFAAVAWTIGYDTIYAIQDLEDDPIAGIKSSARFFGKNTRFAVSVFYAIAILCLTLAMLGSRVSPIGLMGGCAFALHLMWQIRQIDTSNGSGALRLFRSNRNAGLLLFGFLMLDVALRGVLIDRL